MIQTSRKERDWEKGVKVRMTDFEILSLTLLFLGIVVGILIELIKDTKK